MTLKCRLSVPAKVTVGQPVPLRMTLQHDGPQAVQLLTWGTPFEGQWFAAFVSVQRFRPGGATLTLPYLGPQVKRAAPQAADYRLLAAGPPHSASLDLAQVFDLSQPGRYEVLPQLVLHDVAVGDQAPAAARARQAQTPPCNAVAFEVVG